MRILVTNDDGFDAQGLVIAEAVAGELADDVWTVAPRQDQSGTSQSISLHKPLRCVQQSDRRYTLTGTPADCVMFSVAELMADAPPDLVLSGVNHGANLSDTVMYSGTIGAVLAANHLGIASVAMSQAFRGAGPDFTTARDFAVAAIRALWDRQPETRCWSLNFPALAAGSVRGLRLVQEASEPVSRPRVVADTDSTGRVQHRLGFSYDSRHITAPESDIAALRAGFITAMPLRGARSHPLDSTAADATSDIDIQLETGATADSTAS